MSVTVHVSRAALLAALVAVAVALASSIATRPGPVVLEARAGGLDPAAAPALERTEPEPPVPVNVDTAAPAEASALLVRLWGAVDAARAQGGTCGPTRYDPASPIAGSHPLDRAAEAQAAFMVAHDVWSSRTPDNPAGATPRERATAAGHAGWGVAEVLAWGRATPEEAVDWWLGSPLHCAILLDPDAGAGGAAVVDDPQGDGLVWVLVLGRQ
jgi:uncharacterized protein YkwD